MSRADDWFTAPAGDEPPCARQPIVQVDTIYCGGCHLIHAVAVPCEIVRARVEALIIEPGDDLGDAELEGVSPIELVRALAMRGISLEPAADGRWKAVETLADTQGIPVHVDDEDTEPMPGRGQ